MTEVIMETCRMNMLPGIDQKSSNAKRTSEDRNEKLWKLMSTYLGTDVHSIQRTIVNHVEYTLACNRCSMTTHKALLATCHSVRDRLIEDMNDTQQFMIERKEKCVNYLSIEYLLGRLLQSTLINIKLEKNYKEALMQIGYALEDMYEDDKDAALGNGGLGRLAACYMDSLATGNIYAFGYGIRYNYGMFEQKIRDGYQVEYPDFWLSYGNPWEIERKDVKYRIVFGGSIHEEWKDGKKATVHRDYEAIQAIAYDTPIPGYNTHNCNILRLWKAIPTDEIDLVKFNMGDYTTALEGGRRAETITSVLYPDDSMYTGKLLRLKQEYFFVSATIQDIVNRFSKLGLPWSELPNKMSIQLNDTHPALSIPELMRVLMETHGFEFMDAWELVTKVFSYTNHTVMSEALETWPVQMMRSVLPHITQIIFDINWRYMGIVQERFKGQSDLLTCMSQTSIIADEGEQRFRMANLAIIGSHTVNGVSRLHTQILKESTFKYFNMMTPEKFINVTNGVTPRRWLLQANPYLSQVITQLIGSDAWANHLDMLSLLRDHAQNPNALKMWSEARMKCKERLSKYIKAKLNVDIPTHFLFDVMIKRIHEYKRQLLLCLYCVYRYHWIKGLSEKERKEKVVPRVTIFGGKAAPSYRMAKSIIKLIHNVSEIVNNDVEVSDYYKVIFIPDYNVSLAEMIIPAADITEHISTAGTEASGTSNMKSALNGGLLLGTYDGATIEILENVGEDQVFIFGNNAQQIADIRHDLYKERGVKRRTPICNELALVIGQLTMNCYGDSELVSPILHSLTNGNDWYGVTHDFEAYVRAHERVDALWKTQDEWMKRSLLATAGMGIFCSDTSIQNYSQLIWRVEGRARTEAPKPLFRSRSSSLLTLPVVVDNDEIVGMDIS